MHHAGNQEQARAIGQLRDPAHLLGMAIKEGDRLPGWDERVGNLRAADRPVQDSSGLSGEVYQILLNAPSRFPSMETVAAYLGLQERTLRRRLAAEDSSYGGIVDDVRRRLAIEYLQTTRMSVDDVAWKVGFSDGANLRRAIRRWTGKTVAGIRASKAGTA